MLEKQATSTGPSIRTHIIDRGCLEVTRDQCWEQAAGLAVVSAGLPGTPSVPQAQPVLAGLHCAPGPSPELRTHTCSSWDLEPVCWLSEGSLGGNPSSQNSCADDVGDPGQARPSSVGGEVGASAGSRNPISQHSPSAPSNRLLCRLCLPWACGDLTLTVGGSPRATLVAGLRQEGEAATGWPAPGKLLLEPSSVVWSRTVPEKSQPTDQEEEEIIEHFKVSIS